MATNQNTVKSQDDIVVNQGGRKSDVLIQTIEKCDFLQKRYNSLKQIYEDYLYIKTRTNSRKEWAYYKMQQSGSFATSLCKAYELADLDNRRRLEIAYPHLFSAAKNWMYSDDPDKYLDDILNEADDE